MSSFKKASNTDLFFFFGGGGGGGGEGRGGEGVNGIAFQVRVHADV